MSDNIFKPLGSSNHCKENRDEDDFYSTDPIAVKHLLEMDIGLSNNLWECACGLGDMAKPLIEEGYNVKSTDLIDRGFGVGGVDFFQCHEKFNGDIVTNPPYKLAKEFVEHAFDLIDDGNKVCMFLKLLFLESKSRYKLFEKCKLKYLYVSSSRITCYKGGINNTSLSSAIAYGWYIFEKGYTGEPIIRWFNY